ncbi:MAG: hypothetical protein LBM87_00965 [Ruminococcus sp.]|jgi:vacuolar-type H+-ATPase subunit H|nr:hypothetical protein [Ruminococcus sp.]
MEEQGNNVINEIIEIDDNANKKLEDAKNKSISMIAEAKRKKEAIISDKLNEINSKLSAVETEESGKSDTKLEEIKSEQEKGIAHLDEVFDGKKHEWLEEIIQAVVNC